MNRSSTKTFLKGGLLIAIGALVLVGTVGNGADHANAEELNFSATIKPSLLVTIPSDTISLNINPEIGKDTFASTDLNVVVSTNNQTGYQMNVTSTSTDLVKTEADNSGNFAKLPTLAALDGGYTEETFTANHWGYKVGTGNYLPFSTNTNLINTTSPANGEETTITFGAKVNMDQPYGIYELTLNFQTVANVVPVYMQGYTLDQCQAEASSAPVELIDSRDGKVYRVRYINGICTMIDNLDLELTTGMVLTPDTTNVTTTRTLGTVGSLTTNDNTGSYNQVRTARNTGVPGAGLHYNYAAATAGMIMGDSNSTEATEDICPAGWRLPTGGQNQEQFILNNSYTWQQWNSNFPTAFAPVAAGYYYSGSLNRSGTYGYWWSSTAYGTAYRYNLSYYTSNGLYSGGYNNRYGGLSVRCVREKPGTTISFNANGGTGTMDMQKIDAGQSANLTANTFTRTDYVFTGWNTEPDGSGTSYSNQANYTAPASEDDKIVVLYAQWAEMSLQSFTKARCQAEASSAPVELTDSRDGKVYRARYINGVCTMIDNLRVDKSQVMTPADTNINSNWTMTDRDLTTGDNSYDLPEIHEGDATTGHWYNYAAATAGTITGSSNTTEATQDICPKGWKLPDGHNAGTSGATTLDQYKLANNKWQSYDKTYQTVFNSVAAGLYDSGSLYNSGTYGFWWSSTANDTTNRYYLNYNTSFGLRSGSGISRDRGFSVRCVLK